MVAISEIRKKSQKKYWSFSQKLRHEMAYPITKFFISTPITPNMVTVFWIFMGLTGSLLLLKGSYWFMLIGTLVFNLSFVFDAVDGQLARFKKNITYTGFYIDKIGHLIGTPIFFFCLGYGASIHTNYSFFLYLGIIIGLSHLLIESIDFNGFWGWCNPKTSNPDSFLLLHKVYVQFRVASLAQSNILKRIILELFKRSQPFNILFFLVLLDKSWIVLIIYAFLFLIKFSYKLFQQFHSLFKLDKENSSLRSSSVARAQSFIPNINLEKKRRKQYGK